MDRKRHIISLLVIVGLTVCLGGCFGTTPPSRFYTLTPRVDSGVSASEGVGVIIRVGPVTLPSYLDRRQIVTRSGQNEIDLAEFDRWGGSLDEEITRLLVISLTRQLASKGITVVPWSSVNLANAPLLYRIPVNLSRFDGALGETVVLNASWGVLFKKDKEENPLVIRESMITEVVGGNDYASLVAAMGKVVERLGKEIAESITTLKEGK
jgi:uncharacterized lipoprotein YmbA